MAERIDITAPAKINRFLHITGQRPDGYHTLQTVFELIDLQDKLQLETRVDGIINLIGGQNSIKMELVMEDDLAFKAAKLLQQYTGAKQGCNITLTKRIPVGAGLGGGSSDAASVLWGLNKIWHIYLRKDELMRLGVTLGADIPFFLMGSNAFAEGIGDILTTVSLPVSIHLLIYPEIHISTASVFKIPDLCRNHPKVTVSDFLERPDDFGCNDCEPVVARQYPDLLAVKDWVTKRHPSAKPRLTGTGSTIFIRLPYEIAQSLLNDLPPHWTGFVVRGLDHHPSICYED